LEIKMSNMHDILKKINLIESSVEECGGDMGSMNSMPPKPSTPVTLNMSAGSASEMSQMLKALANIDAGKDDMPTLSIGPKMGMTDDINESNPYSKEGEYYDDDMQGTIYWQIEDVDRGFGSEGENFTATFSKSGDVDTEFGPQARDEEYELEGKELERAKERVYQDMKDEDEARGDYDYEQKRDRDMDNESYSNEPDETYGSVEDVTASGDDLHKRKKSYGPTSGGDNPMAMDETYSIKARLVKALNEKKAKPDFLDVDKDGDKKEPMKKAVKDAGKGKGSKPKKGKIPPQFAKNKKK
jgi:hypothetical protein